MQENLLETTVVKDDDDTHSLTWSEGENFNKILQDFHPSKS